MCENPPVNYPHVKRLFLIASVLGVLLTATGANAASSKLPSDLLVTSQLPPHWRSYHVSRADTANCVEASFRSSPTHTRVRTFFIHSSAPTQLLAEELTTTSHPIATYKRAVASVAKCSNSNASFAGYSVSQSVHAVNLGSFAVPTTAYMLIASAGPVTVTSYLLFAHKHHTVMALGVASTSSVDVRAFKLLVVKAIAKID